MLISGGPTLNLYGKNQYETHVGHFWAIAKKVSKLSKNSFKIIKIPLKTTKNRGGFLDICCERFLVAFWYKLVPQGGPGDLKNHQKLQKVFKKPILGYILDKSFCKGGFWEDFGRISERF